MKLKEEARVRGGCRASEKEQMEAIAITLYLITAIIFEVPALCLVHAIRRLCHA
jgi:hypothetical protein